ncbi:MAG: hypothetical protein H6852_16185 [Geminicoccaceae bacterium]|jgi:hypothetical protein|nr:hypothetical protein [Geminicoccaceae bacterium]MCB9969159.1 hypothetical protein [Geminicoccaceae bacterium]HRY22882.1 hypothetical protein [Geminicoccaceae bacterium]
MLGLGSLDFLMRLIWQATLVLVAIGLILIASLVLRRLLEEWAAARHRPAREGLRRALLASLNRPSGDPVAAPAGLPVAEIARLVDELAQIVRGDAKARLAAFAVGAGIERYWLRRLRSATTLRRLDAVRCLGLLATDPARGALTTMLAQGDARHRLAAAEALAQDTALAAWLVERLLVDPASRGRHAARFWHRLAANAPETVVTCLARADVDAALLIRLLEALGDAGHTAAATEIEALLGRHGAAVDRTALVTLDRLNHPAVLRLARALGGAPEAESRRAALGVLERRGRARDAELVSSLALDPVVDIAANAEKLLARLRAATADGAVPA